MSELSSRVLNRLRDVKKEAIHSRRFSSEKFTYQGVQLILFGLKIENSREELLKRVANKLGDEHR